MPRRSNRIKSKLNNDGGTLVVPIAAVDEIDTAVDANDGNDIKSSNFHKASKEYHVPKKGEDADDESDATADYESESDADADTALLARPPDCSHEEVSQTVSSNFAFWRMYSSHMYIFQWRLPMKG